MATVDTKDLLTTAEAAAALGLSTDTVKKYCQKALIDGMKLGNSWFVSKSEVKRYSKERKDRGRPASE